MAVVVGQSFRAVPLMKGRQQASERYVPFSFVFRMRRTDGSRGWRDRNSTDRAHFNSVPILRFVSLTRNFPRISVPLRLCYCAHAGSQDSQE